MILQHVGCGVLFVGGALARPFTIASLFNRSANKTTEISTGTNDASSSCKVTNTPSANVLCRDVASTYSLEDIFPSSITIAADSSICSQMLGLVGICITQATSTAIQADATPVSIGSSSSSLHVESTSESKAIRASDAGHTTVTESSTWTVEKAFTTVEVETLTSTGETSMVMQTTFAKVEALAADETTTSSSSATDASSPSAAATSSSSSATEASSPAAAETSSAASSAASNSPASSASSAASTSSSATEASSPAAAQTSSAASSPATSASSAASTSSSATEASSPAAAQTSSAASSPATSASSAAPTSSASAASSAASDSPASSASSAASTTSDSSAAETPSASSATSAVTSSPSSAASSSTTSKAALVGSADSATSPDATTNVAAAAASVETVTRTVTTTVTGASPAAAAVATDAAVSGVSGSVSAQPNQNLSKDGSDVYRAYTGDGTIAAGWPWQGRWLSFDQMFEVNTPNMQASCVQWNVPNNTDSEMVDMRQAILDSAQETDVDARFILATLLQESSGCVRVITTESDHPNPGLMQSHAGQGTCNSNKVALGTDTTSEFYIKALAAVHTPCASSKIAQQISDGVNGTATGDGLKQLLQKQGNTDVSRFYRAARLYNSGSVNADGQLSQGYSTNCYASDIANRLTGWVNAERTCVQ